MLIIADKLSSINFSMFMDVYMEANINTGLCDYGGYSKPQQRIFAEDDFYKYLNDIFFAQRGAKYFIWASDGVYKAALRLEPYCDGLLLTALETRPDSRRMGYGFKLVQAVTEYLSQQGNGILYSHIEKRNRASLLLHKKCGFQIEKDYAVFLDGSITHNSYTLQLQY